MSKGVLESLCEISHLSCLQSQSELWCRVRVNFSEGVRENFFKNSACVCVCVLFVHGAGVRDNNTECIVCCLAPLDSELCLTAAGQTIEKSSASLMMSSYCERT